MHAKPRPSTTLKFKESDQLTERIPFSVVPDQVVSAAASASAVSRDTGTGSATHWTAFLCSFAVPLSTIAAVFFLSSAPACVASSSAGFLLGSISSIIVSVVTPALDLLLGSDNANPAKADLPELSSSAPYRHILRGYALLQMATLLLVCHYLATTFTPAAWPAALGLTLGTGTVAGVGFTVAHELIHSQEPFDQHLAHLQLSSVLCPHWALSHLGHHVKVATPEDPSSARLNELLWAFIPRSVWGNLVEGLRMERRRLREAELSLLSLRNRMWAWLATPLVILAGLWAAWGGVAVAVLLGHAVRAVAMLEAANYVQHYGLTRRKLPSGRYEKTGARHSWNADFKATNRIIFKIQRHADHHISASLPYQALSSIRTQAPQLPASYPLMMIMAVLPPVWFGVMNPILEAEEHRLDALERRAAAAPGPQGAAADADPYPAAA